MKNNIKVLVMVFIALLTAFMFIAASPRLSTVTESTTRLADNYRITTITWIADSTGAVTSTASTILIRGIIDQIITDPDTSVAPAIEDSSGRAPTTLYDITLTNTIGLDVAGGALANRSATATEIVKPMMIMSVAQDDTIPISIINNSKLTTAVTNNKIGAAKGHIYIYWQEK